MGRPKGFIQGTSAGSEGGRMEIKTFHFNPFLENTFVCYEQGVAAIIDPGCSTEYERDELVRFIKQEKLNPTHLLLTHAHIDHILGCACVAEKYGLEIWMHEADVPLLSAATEQGQMYGIRVDDPPPVGKLIGEDDTLTIADSTWSILHCPGHSPGSICFVDEAAGFVIGGDVLFKRSVGRADLWKGSMPDLIHSIRTKLLPMDDEVVVYPGHGPETTIGEERKMNPFLT